MQRNVRADGAPDQRLPWRNTGDPAVEEASWRPDTDPGGKQQDTVGRKHFDLHAYARPDSWRAPGR
jgi:hypothetical protein